MSSANHQRLAPAGCSRRGLIRGAASALLAVTAGAGSAGCDLLDPAPEPTPEPDPLADLLTGTVELAASYDATRLAHPDLDAELAPIAAAHRAHATELARITGITLPDPASVNPAGTAPGTGSTATPGASTPPDDGTPRPGSSPTAPAAGQPQVPSDPAAALAALRSAEEAAAAAAAEACRAAPADRAALLGSITAARTCHIEVLR
ncbi:hypothetical protein ACN27F_08095 [Solwaraspora sp. WMMB335]|uniref:hypothetical protein n=1 Tax=Solwaraspora sp. WMMB335 TaxID=3404118 RepID=UPI003B92EF60